MIAYPTIDPVLMRLGPIAIHWYGVMYVLAFFGARYLGLIRAKKQNQYHWLHEHIDDLITYAAIGVLLGGRIGYILFYNFQTWLEHPLSVFKIWEGGMSFHGGFIGVLCAVWLFARRVQQPFFHVIDFCAPLTPLGIALGRLGNFINGELWGRPTDLPWGMIFPQADSLTRHPSQLYECLL